MNGDPRSHGLWEESAPPPPPASPLDGEIEVDVVAIGGGFTGLSTALHAAEAGASVAVLEADEVGFGGSGRNVGLVNAGMWVMPDELPRVLGEKHGDALLNLLGDAPRVVFELVAKHGMDCQAEPNGTLHCAVGHRDSPRSKERERQWRARGAPVQPARRRRGGGEDRDERLRRRAARPARRDDPAARLRARPRPRGDRRRRAHLRPRARSSAPIADGDRWIVRTPQGAARAKWVIVATNAYTVAPWTELRAELTHLPYFNFATARSMRRRGGPSCPSDRAAGTRARS